MDANIVNLSDTVDLAAVMTCNEVFNPNRPDTLRELIQSRRWIMSKRENVIIFGGQLFNKGAQAMTFITVDEISKRFPKYKIYLLSTGDYKRDVDDKGQYKFSILPFPRFRILFLAVASKRLRFLKAFAADELDKTVIDVIHNAKYVLDISGYSLGDDWGCDASIGYCLRVKYAHKCGAKVYLMPQSFGPFDYKGKQATKALKQIKKCLPHAELIMAREEEGYLSLKRMFNLKNVIKTNDMVLQNKGIDLSNVYTVVPNYAPPQITTDSVAIIPNSKTFKFGDESEQFLIYDEIVLALKNNGKSVYFLSHSSEDHDISVKLFERYKQDYNECYLMDKEFSCIEFDRIVSKFNFIIASRYHSIVHSYRNSVPAIVLGWAIKYKELMELFDQNDYQFNVRDTVDLKSLVTTLDKMCARYKEESLVIKNRLYSIQNENVFDLII